MAMRFWIFCVSLAFLAGLCYPGASCAAKPPDLPLNLDVECPDASESPPEGSIQLDLDIFGGGVSLHLQASSTPAPDTAPCLDPWAPLVVDALYRQFLAQLPRTGADNRAAAKNSPRGGPGRKPREDGNPADFDQIRHSQARTMFLIGERCRKKGDFDKARTCYQEAHLLCPLSKYGQRAIDRLEEIDSAATDDNGAAEDQEPPIGAPQSRTGGNHDRRREMLRTTVPLGLVPYGRGDSEAHDIP